MLCAGEIMKIHAIGLMFLLLVTGVYAKSVLLIIDASGSMDGYMPDGIQTKEEAAKEAAIDLIQSSSDEFALMVYTDCDSSGDPYTGDISVWQEFTYDDSVIVSRIQSIYPQDATPIADSIKEGTTYLASKRSSGTIVVLTDGEETCGSNSDITNAIQSANSQGISVNVIGFQLSDYSKTQMQQVVQDGGGDFYSANDTQQLKQAFKQATGNETCCCPTFMILLLPLIVGLGKFAGFIF